MPKSPIVETMQNIVGVKLICSNRILEWIDAETGWMVTEVEFPLSSERLIMVTHDEQKAVNELLKG